ncbi:NAD(P)-dependent oxidoreductase [Sphingomonas sp. RHCKR7]|uniref:NAD(P)-dependent oxidoreductase n=1 Tax=Sphingomonas folli TaxID=2862497 RepID=UPI001CA4D394|nr:NAD(P)-dependent oxidoreductase [Sphingomonas folli]MBW6527813.1 NAD(P)-dependent oxidoreductase [Sphingomonas folli]
MSISPILILGGTGQIGRYTIQALRKRHPEAPLLIGSRNRQKAYQAASELDHAEGIAIDPYADDLGVGDRSIAAVAVLYSDHRLASLRYAHARGIPHLGISTGLYEVAPEMAIHMQRPDAAAVVLGYEWLVGATTIATLTAAKTYARIDGIRIGALIDEEDWGGPAVAEDFERFASVISSVFARRNGAFVWRKGGNANFKFQAIDGAELTAVGFSTIDIAGLAATTGARDVEFGIGTGISSSRRAGGEKSTEIIIELSGVGEAGTPQRTRHAVFHPGGAAPLTGLGISMVLERLAGLDGEPATKAGLFFPYQIINHAEYLNRLTREGGRLLSLPLAYEGET